MSRKYTLYFDGGSRGNPGVAGCGAVLYDSDDVEVDSLYFYCGADKTNNHAEYVALLKGLMMAKEHGANFGDLTVRGDSMLVIKQCKGEFKVRDRGLSILHRQIKDLVSDVTGVDFGNIADVFSKFEHVRREKNKRADELSNIAMDTKGTNKNFNY